MSESLLHSLPPELRDWIYYYVAVDSLKAHINEKQPPAMLSVSRDVRREFSDVYFGKHIMIMEYTTHTNSKNPTWTTVRDRHTLRATASSSFWCKFCTPIKLLLGDDQKIVWACKVAANAVCTNDPSERALQWRQATRWRIVPKAGRTATVLLGYMAFTDKSGWDTIVFHQFPEC